MAVLGRGGCTRDSLPTFPQAWQRLMEQGWKTWRRRYLQHYVSQRFLEDEAQSLLSRVRAPYCLTKGGAQILCTACSWWGCSTWSCLSPSQS